MYHNSRELQGKRVYGGKKGTRKKGKISRAVFYPDSMRLAGFVLRRPDILLMFKRSDVFVAMDALAIRGDHIVADNDADAWNQGAFDRLGLCFDECFMWEDMPIITTSGIELGGVRSLHFDASTGYVDSLEVSEGPAAHALTGDYEIPIDLVRGHHDDSLVVDDEAYGIEASGGLAAAAGRGVAKAGKAVSDATAKAGEAVNRGAYALGGIIGDAKSHIQTAGKPDTTKSDDTQYDTNTVTNKDSSQSNEVEDESTGEAAAYAIGKQLGKTKGMFASFKGEFEKNLHENEAENADENEEENADENEAENEDDEQQDG